MKKRIILLSSGAAICLGILLYFQLMSKNNLQQKNIKTQNSSLAIMVKEEGATEYTRLSSNSIPKGQYVLNEEKTYCKNNGKVSNYDSTTGTISFAFIGTDKCYLYFDVVTDNESPQILNLKISGTTVTATLSDNKGLASYGISTSNTTEPTSWTTISGTSYSLSTTITTEGTYYLWVKDTSGNKAISTVIDLEMYGWKTILLNNGNGATTVEDAMNYISYKGMPSFESISATNEGMYGIDDDSGISYYFRGAVNNNWLKFGKDSSGKEMYWRIVRINGDGSIKIIYSGTTKPTSSTAVKMTGTGTQINATTYAYNTSYNNPAYVGYMYTASVQHGISKESTIKTTIDSWYKTTTLETDSATKDMIADQIFCNDRSAATSSSDSAGEISGNMSTSKTYYYGSNIRLKTEKSPKLGCYSESDAFTVDESIGNGALTYPVGLITADEVAIAGGVENLANSYYYLYTGQGYWTGSPHQYLYTSKAADMFYIGNSGYLSRQRLDSTMGVRPVINLSSKVKLSGDGTYNNVYTVK